MFCSGMPKILDTPHGQLTLRPVNPAELASMRRAFPFGIAQFQAPVDGARFGVVMQCGDEDVKWIKQSPDVLQVPAVAARYHWINSVLVAHAVARYAANGFTGLYFPCVYWRKQMGGLEDVGYAHFITPSPRGIESQEFYKRTALDGVFGEGSSTMLKHFVVV